MLGLKEKFESKYVLSGDGCWQWIASKFTNGYGQLKYLHNGKLEQYAHRLSMHLYKGFDLDPSTLVCHRCDNTSCVNPDHLFLGTYTDNNRDTSNKGRHVCWNRKLDDLDRELIQFLRVLGVKNVDIAKHFCISQSVASVVARGRRHNHDG